jgi:hypothetical protein
VVIAGGVKRRLKLTGNTNKCGIRKLSEPEPERRTTCMRLHVRGGGVSGDSKPNQGEGAKKCAPGRRGQEGSGNHGHRGRLVER